MKRLIGAVMALAIAASVPAAVLAQGAQAKGGGKAAAPKAMNAQGTVTAVAADSISVKGKTDTWTFAVDKTTTVKAKGATHKMDALKADGKPPMLTEFVKVGDTVAVTYHDMGATKHAANIAVTTPSK